MNRNRCIFHVDMDAFYASVEQRDHPEMLGLPVVVGGGERRGVVAAASYEARRFGVRSAMPMAEALRRCPKAVRVRPRMHHYKSVSQEIFDIFADFTPVVEGLSLDEAFLDLSGSIAGPAAAHDIATQLKLRIRRELALTASIGVGPNKLVAKIASDLDKPDGLRTVTAEQVHATLDPLPVQRIPGIGPRTLPRLYDAGIKTIGDLRLASEQKLRPVFGRHWYTTQQRAAGCDEREVHSHGIAKSVSAETTFDLDINDSSELMRVVSRLTDQSIGRLRRQELEAAVVTLKIRDHKFRTATRQTTLRPPTASRERIHDAAAGLLRSWLGENPGLPLRLLGVGLGKLSATGQLGLFDSESPGTGERIDSAIDEVQERYGDAALVPARSLR